jgi:hypothetical protein
MRWRVHAAALAAILLLSGSADAGDFVRRLSGFFHRGDEVRLIGNDTGGIIPWSPAIELRRFEIASDHCARYLKDARITSVHRQYGDYIGFVCRFGPDPAVRRARSDARLVHDLDR